MIHSTRRFLQSMQQDFILVKLNFKTAFNSLCRNQMLLFVYCALPELAQYCHFVYTEPTALKLATFLFFADGSRARGHLHVGTLPFCLPHQPISLKLSFALTFGYHHDLNSEGTTNLEMIELESEKLGLHPNSVRCEVILLCPFITTYNCLKKFMPFGPEAVSLLVLHLLHQKLSSTFVSLNDMDYHWQSQDWKAS